MIRQTLLSDYIKQLEMEATTSQVASDALSNLRRIFISRFGEYVTLDPLDAPNATSDWMNGTADDGPVPLAEATHKWTVKMKGKNGTPSNFYGYGRSYSDATSRAGRWLLKNFFKTGDEIQTRVEGNRMTLTSNERKAVYEIVDLIHR